MTQMIDRPGAPPSVTPLRMRKLDGNLYRRPEEVERAITSLSQLSAKQVVEHSRIEDSEDPDYVPSECVLYFIRRPSLLSDEDALRELFVILRRRVLRAVPVPVGRVCGSHKLAEKVADLEVQEAVLQKFQELLCSDRCEYNQRLDFYECRFNSALARLRLTARRDVQREESHYDRTTSGDDLDKPSRKVELALASIRNPIDGERIDSLYRSRLHAAISSLPRDERCVIELLLQGLPIDSKDKEVRTIVRVLRCSEKTVRNRRDRAFEKLRYALKEEEDV